jgi:NADP-dependent 3-hydroxy acid dehydrogenase YdfG
MSTDHNTGRVAVITGASSGIGEATARALAADGHRVALLARRADRLQALADELGNGAIAIEADVTDRESIVAAAERVQREFGGADILVNNAGVMLTAPFASDQREEHRRMVETNLLGAMTVTEVFLEQLRANGGGDLVNISSVAGRVAPAGFAAYAATKWGINGWSEALRVELQPAIRVMVIEPGAIATELSDHITHAESRRAAKEYLDMAIPPHDIADVIAFAVSRPRRMTLNEILVRPTLRLCERRRDHEVFRYQTGEPRRRRFPSALFNHSADGSTTYVVEVR